MAHRYIYNKPISTRTKGNRHKKRGVRPLENPWNPIKRYFLSDKPLDYDQFLLSPYWLDLRKETLNNRDKCEDCGFTKLLQLHHLYYYRNGRSVLYHEREHPGIFVVICRDCHKKRHPKA